MLELDHDAAPLCLGKHDLLLRRAAEQPGLISFAGGLPDPKLFPKKDLSEAFLVALQSQGGAALQYGWPEGSLELRSAIAAQLRDRGADVQAERVIITSGAQQAVMLALAAVKRCARVGVEPECYPGALDIFRSARAALVGLEQPAELYYVMPSVSNPRGRRLGDAARGALLARARQHKAHVIEDDAYEGTVFSGERSRPLLADAPQRVLHVGTFSKTLCPGLRLGWLVAPPALARRALRHKQNLDLQTNGLTQALTVEYLRSGRFARHQEHARQRYERKSRALLAAVKRHLPQFRCQAPRGGFSLWLESDLSIDDERLLEAAVDQGASFDPGRLFRSRPAPGLALRLCYSAVATRDIDPGVARISRALARIGS
jgi:2-aminoadipate transaminase